MASLSLALIILKFAKVYNASIFYESICNAYLRHYSHSYSAFDSSLKEFSFVILFTKDQSYIIQQLKQMHLPIIFKLNLILHSFQITYSHLYLLREHQFPIYTSTQLHCSSTFLHNLNISCHLYLGLAKLIFLSAIGYKINWYIIYFLCFFFLSYLDK